MARRALGIIRIDGKWYRGLACRSVVEPEMGICARRPSGKLTISLGGKSREESLDAPLRHAEVKLLVVEEIYRELAVDWFIVTQLVSQKHQSKG
jgi:hypothetical protein